MSEKKDKTNDIISELKTEGTAFSKKFLINVNESPKRNVDLAYFELANQSDSRHL